MDLQINIEFISTEQTFLLRRAVLEHDPSNENVKLEKDDDPESFHLGAIYNKEIVSIVTFHKTTNDIFNESFQYQLRKMATSTDYRNLHLGKKLIAFGIEFLKNKGVQLIWCNARAGAIGFYEKSGFIPVGDFFDFPPIGLHKVLSRKLEAGS